MEPSLAVVQPPVRPQGFDQLVLFFARQERRGHRGSNKLSSQSGKLSHFAPLSETRTFAMRADVSFITTIALLEGNLMIR